MTQLSHVSILVAYEADRGTGKQVYLGFRAWKTRKVGQTEKEAREQFSLLSMQVRVQAAGF
jgi:hypothetical protein